MLRETVIVVVTALALSVLVKTFLAQGFYIPSASMEDTLVVGDRIMVSKLTPRFFEVERGDIVVFVDPDGWLDPLPEEDTPAWQRAAQEALTFVGLLPQDAGDHLVKRVIGVAGDRVACCTDDGRLTVNGEPIDEPYLKEGTEPSTVAFDVVVEEDSLWVMGDNRDNSEDSRAHLGEPGGGMVPVDNVAGTVFVVMWPLDRFEWITRPAQVFADVPEPSR